MQHGNGPQVPLATTSQRAMAPAGVMGPLFYSKARREALGVFGAPGPFYKTNSKQELAWRARGAPTDEYGQAGSRDQI